jgi:hypothetical protein
MKPWLYHLLVAAAVVIAVVGTSAWLANAGLPALSRTGLAVDSPLVGALLLTFGVVP